MTISELSKSIFNRQNYVRVRLWFRRRFIDVGFFFPRWFRLDQREREDQDGYREALVFKRVGKHPQIIKQLPTATRPPPATREATIGEALKLKNFGSDPVLDQPADPYPPVVAGFQKE